MLIKNTRGQSVVETIFAIAILALFLTGSVVLLTNSLGAKDKSGDRKVAAALGQLVIEDLVKEEKTNSEEFWLLKPISNGRLSERVGYGGYSYAVSYTDVTTGSCNVPGERVCVTATVKVTWADNQDGVTFSRFFSKIK